MKYKKYKIGAGGIVAIGLFFIMHGPYAQSEGTSQAVQKAEYVGMKTCAMCHIKESERFKLTSHYRTSFEEEEFKGEGCESCHGPGSLHIEGGDKTKIVRDSSEKCFSCHMDKRAQFQLQFHHPVPEGRMSCTDCHAPHGRDVKVSSVTSLTRPDETCFKCHKEQKGPFIFEHDAMREGCQICHNAHGSVYDKLLIADQSNLCLRCHWEPNFNTVAGNIGGVPHGAAGGGNFEIGRGEECIDHHRAPHGSNIWRTLNR